MPLFESKDVVFESKDALFSTKSRFSDLFVKNVCVPEMENS